jgi:hypothetical protein
MADIKNFGIKGLSSDVQMGKSGGRLKYDSGSNQFDFTQSNGSTLENVRFGSVVAGTWTGTAIGAQYGGTGQDFSSSSGIIKVSGGTFSAGSAISLTSEVSGTLPIANGGTGGTTAAGARTGLGLGSIATQDITNVTLTGGTINDVVIGGSTPAAANFTTIGASGAITGDLTGNADTATALATGRTIGMTGDMTWTSASFDGTGNVTGAGTLATVNSNVGQFGTTTAIPVVTVNAKGLVTAVTTATISTALTIAADNGSNDSVALGTDTLTFEGTSNEVETTVSNNKITIGLPSDVTIGNDLTVTGTLNSDDITSSTVTITGDAVVSGTLTVNGTTTTVNSTTVQVDDPTFELGDPGISSDDNLDRGIKFNWHNGSAAKTGFFGYDDSASEFVFIADATDNSNTFTGTASNLRVGDIAGGAIVGTSLTGASGASVTEFSTDGTMGGNSATAVPTESAVKTYVDTQITAQDLDFQGDSGGALAIDLDSETLTIAGGTGLSTVGSGNGVTVSLDNTAVTAGNYGTTTAIPVITVDAQGRITAATTAAISTSWTLTGDSGSQVIAGGDTVDIAGGTNITTVASATDTLTVNLDTTLTSMTAGTFSGQVSAGTLTDGAISIASGTLTGGVAGTFSGALQGGTVTDGTLSINSGSITSGVAGSFSGALTAGSFTDGAATLTSGALSGVTTIGASGLATVGSLTDGTATLSSGSLTGAVNVTASGTVQFGSLSDGVVTATGFQTTLTDSDTIIPTSGAVKDYVDAVATAADLDFQGDSGGALSIDLDSEVLDIAGGSNITTTGSGNTLTVALDATVSGLTSVSATTVTDGVASLSSGSLTGIVDLTTSGNMIVGGNLTVSGTTTSVNSTNTTIADTLVVLQSGLTGNNPNDIGHIYERGSDGNNGFFGWDQSTDRFMAGTTTADGSTAGDLSLTAAGLEVGALVATGVTASGVISFGTLTDAGETIAVTKFVDEADGISNNNNDTSIPTSAAVIDYVENNGGDGLMLRQALVSGSTTINTAAMPNVSGRTYYASKIVVKIGTAFSGGSFNQILVKENGGAGTSLVAADDADAATVGTYIVELDGDITLTKNAVVQVQFMQSNGSTAATTTAGAGTITVHYNYV